jgi:hypothetical protein
MNTAAARGAGAPKPGLSLVLDPVAPVAAGLSAPATPAQPPAPQAPQSAQPEASAAAPVKRAYPAPADLPTQEGPKGMRFDFNDGCRVHLPESEHPWRVRLTDLDTGNILFETEIKAGRVNSSKRYYIRFRLEAWQNNELLLSHDYSAADREIMIQFPVGTLGDPVGWFPYAVKFQEQHGCKLTCAMGEAIISLFRKAYPQINFVTHEEVKPEDFYATYSIGLFFDDKSFVHQPCDFRFVGLHRTAGYILGVEPTEVAPRMVLDDDTRPIPENHIPNGAEDQTGDQPLQERARWLRHADFFVGLSSGLSWLAWAAGPPVVMIAGFTHPTNEFATPHRGVNYHACNSCWNDPAHRFDHKDFLYCPRHKDTPRQFECTRLITVDQVKSVIQRVPGFGKHKAASIKQTS